MLVMVMRIRKEGDGDSADDAGAKFPAKLPISQPTST